MTNLHQDFEWAPERIRWTGTLAGLFEVLRREALAAGEGIWVNRVLPRGAFVGMRTCPREFPRRELRIARSEPPEGEKAKRAWDVEIRTFLEHGAPLGGARWEPVGGDQQTKKAGIYRLFIELWSGEVSRGVMVCADCGKPCEWSRLYNPPRCQTCALEAGAVHRLPAPEGFDGPESAGATSYREWANR